MITQSSITQRVKFLIKYLVDKGIAANQEEIGALYGVKSKSQVSMLVNGRLNNAGFLNFLLTYAPEVKREWLYDESITEPFREITAEVCLVENEKKPEDRITELEHTIELLKRDVRYYADMADSRLQTIEVQTKLINVLVNK